MKSQPFKLILRDAVAERRGKDSWFQIMCQIGPVFTPDKSKAMRFDSREEIAMHPVSRYTMLILRVEEVPA